MASILIYPWKKHCPFLGQRGVTIKGSVVRSDAGNFAHLEDSDGNDISLWEQVRRTCEPELVHSSL